MRKFTLAALAALILLPSSAGAGKIPIGFEAKGGFGIGYYSMTEFNDHLQAMREDMGLNFEDMTSDFNVMLEGRVWLFGRLAGTVGYEHYWAEHVMPTGASSRIRATFAPPPTSTTAPTRSPSRAATVGAERAPRLKPQRTSGRAVIAGSCAARCSSMDSIAPAELAM